MPLADLLPAFMPRWSLALYTLAAGAVYLTFTLLKNFTRSARSPLRTLPGPQKSHWLYGNLQRVLEEEPGKPHLAWTDEFGGAVRYHGFFGDDRLLLSDPVALNHVLLSQSYSYPKPNEVRGQLSRILGKGVFFAEGDDHRRQRRIMNPAFSAQHLRALVPSFFAQSYRLRDRWARMLAAGESDANAFANEEAHQEYLASAVERKEDEKEIVIEVSKWFSRLTLDIIGLTGFGYSFGALDNESNKLGNAVSKMINTGASSRMTARGLVIGRFLSKLITLLPVAQFIPNERLRAVREAFATLDDESRKIVQTQKAEFEKSGGQDGAKDLMTLLIKANSGDAKLSMTDSELQGQLTTFILAGHETTSVALTFTLYHLARQPAIQDRLRNEIRAARRKATDEGRDELESDELNGLEYLDAVCREVLRLESPVSATIRTSTKFDIIPLSAPVASPHAPGGQISEVHCPAGQTIFISTHAVNKNKLVFGEDAREFRPERWLDGAIGENVKTVGIWSHLLTFLAGPRACIGYRFAILELKAILATLIDDFAFAERSPGLPIERRTAIVSRPLIVGEEQLGYRMPLRMTRAKRD